MKTKGIILVGIFVLIGSLANAFGEKDRNLLNYYFLQKGLRSEVVKNVIKDADGNLKPIQIYPNAKVCRNLDANNTSVHVQSLDLTKEEDVFKVVIVYHIDNQIEVINTFVSDNCKDWKPEDTSIHHYTNTEI